MRFICVCITVILPHITYTSNLACGNVSKEILWEAEYQKPLQLSPPPLIGI